MFVFEIFQRTLIYFPLSTFQLSLNSQLYTFNYSKPYTLNSQLNNLSRILHLLPQHRAKDHLNILDERIISIIIAIQPQFIGINNILFLQVSIPLCPHFSCLICFRDFFPYLYFIFIRNERLVKFIKRASNGSSKST